MSYLPPHKRFIMPDLPSADEIYPYLKQIDENQWYSNFGPLVTEFEQRFAVRMASAHNALTPPVCVTTTSGTHALSIGMRLLGVGIGSRVLVPAITFPACPLAVENLGAEALLVDVDPISWTLTPAIARAIAAQEKIDAVMPVCLYGMEIPADEWDRFMDETGIPVIIDAAAAVETQRYLKRGLVAHSLHALKPFGVGEGGLLVTHDAEMAAKARQMTNFGTINRITYGVGENAKMSEFHGAVALAQLARWEACKVRRRTVYDLYKAELEPLKPKTILHPNLDTSIVSNLALTVSGKQAATLTQKLIAKGVPAHRTYLPPLYTHPHFERTSVINAQGQRLTSSDPAAKTQHMTGAEQIERSVLALPFHSSLQAQQIHEIVMIFGEALANTTEAP